MANPCAPVMKFVLATDGVISGGETLDWGSDLGDGNSFGYMGRVLLRNKGPNSVWVRFDVDGGLVVADNTTAPLTNRYELLKDESLNVDNTSFFKIGLKCAVGETAMVHAIAFQTGGGQSGGII